MNKELVIFDTTLRDGEQSPGASMSVEGKVKIAYALEALGVDVIEAGFPASSESDARAVSLIAKNVTKSTVCAFARASASDIDAAAVALQNAVHSRLHTFIATSEIQMEKKLGLGPEAVLERAIAAVRYARRFVSEVEFTPEDGSRSDPDFLCRVIEGVIDAGASVINIADTVGAMLPETFGALIRTLRERVPNAERVIWSAHCHNDLGLAVANSLAAIAAGATQIECTVNGIGERAGNAALEEVVMAVRSHPNEFQCDSRVDARKLLSVSQLVSKTIGYPIPRNKAIVGGNAFAHEAGIHQDGVLKDSRTYEFLRPEDVGQGSALVLGRHSGRKGLEARLSALGMGDVDPPLLSRVLQAVKECSEEVSNEELLNLVRSVQSNLE